MAEPRIKKSEKTRKAILIAAEKVFSEYGFEGARVDLIAKVSGFNKTLIFRYFKDKLGLYTEVLRLADREWGELITCLFRPLLEDPVIFSDFSKAWIFFNFAFEFFFDYMTDHPRFMRILNWEQAEGWQTFSKIASQFEPGDLPRLEAVFSDARKSGFIRIDIDPIVVITLVQQICWSTAANLTIYRLLLKGKKNTAETTLEYLRKQVIDFLIAGILTVPGTENPV